MKFKSVFWAALPLAWGLNCGSATAGSIADVKHVVILMQENISFDHYYGTMNGVRGFNDPNIFQFQNGSSDLYQPVGTTNFVLPMLVTNACLGAGDNEEDGDADIWSAGWWNRWMNDNSTVTMSYYNSTNLPFYHALADNYTLCDNNFCSFPGPTFPNRLFLFSGTVDPNGLAGGPVLGDNIPTNGLGWTTYPERLQSAGVSWRVYRPVGDWFGDALQWFSQYVNASPGNPLYDRGMATVNNVLTAFAADVNNGTLPQVSWVIPEDLSWSEHSPYDVHRGEWFVQHILSALAANPEVFNSTVFILTYDENGGLFDHVIPPVPPPGTTNEFYHGNHLGLGIRVPMFIVSPWSRGGRVCSQVFDHTSIIRFLEQWTGVREPNISDWRRQVCGDLTSALDFTGPDTSPVNLPEVPLSTVPGVILQVPLVPNPQFIPVQAPGQRPACPLPYQPDAWCTTDCNSNRVCVTLTNSGTAGMHFSIYPNAGRTDGPWQYDAPPGGSLNDSFVIASQTNGQYDFTCYGPNGFQRRWAGNLSQDCNQVEITSLIDPIAGSITVGLQNSNAVPANFKITDNLSSGAVWTCALAGSSATNLLFPVGQTNHGWYDLTVKVDADPSFLRHLAGHLENGLFSLTEPTRMVGNTLLITTNALELAPPPGPSGPVIGSITDLVNYLITQLSPPTAATNPVTLYAGAFGGNCALLYPAWASKYVVESSAAVLPPNWQQLNSSPTIVSNWNVVIVPATNVSGFFRLRQ